MATMPPPSFRVPEPAETRCDPATYPPESRAAINTFCEKITGSVRNDRRALWSAAGPWGGALLGSGDSGEGSWQGGSRSSMPPCPTPRPCTPLYNPASRSLMGIFHAWSLQKRDEGTLLRREQPACILPWNRRKIAHIPVFCAPGPEGTYVVRLMAAVADLPELR